MLEFLKENTCDEFIDSLSVKDLKFMKQLLKDIAHNKIEEDNALFDDSFVDNSDYIKAVIYNHYWEEKDIKRKKQEQRKNLIRKIVKK